MGLVHTEKSYSVKPKLDCIYYAPVDFGDTNWFQKGHCPFAVLNQSVHGKYNLVSVWFAKIRCIFPRVQDVLASPVARDFCHSTHKLEQKIIILLLIHLYKGYFPEMCIKTFYSCWRTHKLEQKKISLAVNTFIQGIIYEVHESPRDQSPH